MRRVLWQVFIVAMCTSGSPLTIHAQRPMVDLILSNGKIITVDDRFSIAQAVAIAGDRIVAVGTTTEVMRLAGP